MHAKEPNQTESYKQTNKQTNKQTKFIQFKSQVKNTTHPPPPPPPRWVAVLSKTPHLEDLALWTLKG